MNQAHETADLWFIIVQGDNMCLPALAAKSSPRLDKGKRVYGQNALAASDWPGRLEKSCKFF